MRRLRNIITTTGVVVLMGLGYLIAPEIALAANCTTPALYTIQDTGTSTTTASLVWSNIPSTGPSSCTYGSIRLIGTGRDTSTTNCDGYVAMRLGYSGEGSPDAGSTSYGWMQALFNGTGISQDGTLATTVNKMKVAQIPCNSEDSPDAGAFEVLVPQAFNSHYTKTVLGMSALESEASQDSSYHTARAEFMGIWTNSNSNLTVGYVQIWPYDASNWAAHTHVALYLE